MTNSGRRKAPHRSSRWVPARAADLTSFSQKVYALVRRIPRGRVATYGAIGALIPAPPGIRGRAYIRVRARWVGYALAAAPDSIPWQRVVNARGRISPRPGHGPHVQRELLRREGVRFDKEERISLEKYAWPAGMPRPER
jgi:methylated-DNA-protein-cysteine methyltransferase-like protein